MSATNPILRRNLIRKLTADEVDQNFSDQAEAINAANREWGEKTSSTDGLVYGYFGGSAFNGSTWSIAADGTIALFANQTNYIERTVGGAVTANTAGWTSGKIPMALVFTGDSSIISIMDFRASQTAEATTYSPKFASSFPTTQSQVNEERVSIFRWFPDAAHVVDWISGSLIYDHTAALQAAHDNCPLGCTLWFPRGGGKISDIDADGTCLKFFRPIRILGDGTLNTFLYPFGIGNGVYPIQFNPTPGAFALNYTGMEGIFIGNPVDGTCAGADTVFVNTNSANQYYSKFTLRDVSFGKSDHGYSFRHLDSGLYANSGFACALLDNLECRSGAKFENSGDSITLTNTILTGDRIGLYISLLNGSSCMAVHNCNITAAGGTKIDYAPRLDWRNNNVECTGAGSNGAVVDFNGATSTSYGGIFDGGLISCFGRSTCTQLVRLKNVHGVRLRDITLMSGGPIVTGSVSGTTLTVTAATPGDVIIGATIFAPGNTVDHPVITGQLTGTPNGIGTYSLNASATIASANLSLIVATTAIKTVDSSAQDTKVDANLYGQGILTKVSDSGQNTMGVVKTMTLVATTPQWVAKGAAYSQPSFYKDTSGIIHLTGQIKDGLATTGTPVTIYFFPLGFRPKNVKRFMVPAVGAATYAIVEIYDTASGTGTMTILAATGVTGISLDGISFEAENFGDCVSNG